MDRYALRLYEGLCRCAPEMSFSLATTVDSLTANAGGGTVNNTSVSPLRRYIERYLLYPLRLPTRNADIVHVLDHSYAHLMPKTRNVPYLVTVHDMLPVVTVQRTQRDWRSRMRNRMLRWVLDSLRKADGWIVATEWLRVELAEWLGHDDNIYVVPYGVDEEFFQPAPVLRLDFRRGLKIPDSAFVVLHVGSVGPRKNMETVIAAIGQFRRAGVDAWLLQLGEVFTAEHRADMKTHGIDAVCTVLGNVGESVLRSAYRASDVLLFPSHYEGFGLPVLEAMASELPVISSGAGGLAELSADATVTVGGREVTPYVSALERIASDEQWRSDLIHRGVLRAREFRWSETARKTAELYRHFVAA